MKSHRSSLAVLATATLSIAVAGCESTTDSPTGSPADHPGQTFEDLPDASVQDQEAAAATAEDARVEMERVLTGSVHEAESIDLDMMDFGEADRLYQEAIASDPKNTEAQFGAAVVHLLNLSVNSDVRAVQDSIDAFMEDEDEPTGANQIASAVSQNWPCTLR